MSFKEKITRVAKHIAEIINIMEFEKKVDFEHLKETPMRVAKMFVNEIFRGVLNNPPEIKTFSNEENNSNIVMVSNITVKSTCAHHLVPFYGKATIMYMPDKKLIGLSKFSRVTNYFSRRPQIQEVLTNQIGKFLVEKLEPKKLMVAIRAKHLCMVHRGVNEHEPYTDTVYTFGEIPQMEYQQVIDTLPKTII